MSIISEAEEVPFQLLHGELVKHVLTKSGNDRVKALSDIESIGMYILPNLRNSGNEDLIFGIKK